MNNQFENALIKGVHATRFIMSWVREGGNLHWNGRGYKEFSDWLSSMGLNDEEIGTILEIARNGKMELETSAEKYLKKIEKPK